jgi:hypothetical protein
MVKLVVLKYTDDSGWQIVDDHLYPLPSGVSVTYAGAMTSSGEAWIALRAGQGGSAQFAIWHRAPGGEFQSDQGALIPALRQFMGGGVLSMRLHQNATGVYGLLLTSAPPTTSFQNGSIQGSASLGYAQLVNDSQSCGGQPPCWTVQGTSLPLDYTPAAGENGLLQQTADVTGPGQGWAVFEQTGSGGNALVLARFDQSGWTFLPRTGLDVFDLTGPFAAGSQQSVAAGGIAQVTPGALSADSSGVWVSADVNAGATRGQVVARYDATNGQIVSAWCTGLTPPSSGCTSTLDQDHPAAVPDAFFDTPQGPLAEALAGSSISVYSDGAWTAVPTSGYSAGGEGDSVSVDPTDGWVVGANTLGKVSAAATPSTLAEWPEANRNPLLSVALPPGQSTTDTAGALAVGMQGTALHYDAPTSSWQVDATPPRTHHINLNGVAFAGPSLAFAVGTGGLILRWDGTSWTEDPQSVRATIHTLNAVAFGTDGQGWAVGGLGTILHYDGNTWSPEQLDSQESTANVTSVAVAGQTVYAVANGNLVTRSAGGTWQPVPASAQPTPAPPGGSLKLVSGLPDGGLVVAGRSLLMVKQSATANFAYLPQGLSGIPVAVAAFRDSTGALRAFVSIAPPVRSFNGALSDDVGGSPPGDGDLLLETADGWSDLSHTLPPASTYAAGGDGAVPPDPVLAVAASPDGNHAWAVGGYSGTQTADGVGTTQVLSSRPLAWFTSAIWRYDAGGSVGAAETAQTPVSLPAAPYTVSFAFFSSVLCKAQCSAVPDAQPDVNLSSAATEIAAFAQQPGGPAFAMLGGNARGPSDEGFYGRGLGALDFAHLPQLLRPLSGVPTFAAYGPLDAVPTSADPKRAVGRRVRGRTGPVRVGPDARRLHLRRGGRPRGKRAPLLRVRRDAERWCAARHRSRQLGRVAGRELPGSDGMVGRPACAGAVGR